MRDNQVLYLFCGYIWRDVANYCYYWFIKLMIMDQRQSSNNDLSQSAYDAALAGVEDAKRVVRAAQTGNIQAAGVLNGPINCNMVAASGVVGGSSSGETIIKTGTDAGKKI